ncbi:hypothetical protein Lal_00030170, partial [Lupinus albus]
NIYPSLIWEFNANFQFKDSAYVSLVKVKLFTLDDDLFFQVVGLTSDGSPLGYCNDELWNSYDTEEMYKSCLRGPHYYVQEESTKHLVGENLIHNMGIYECGAQLIYQEDHNTIVDLELTNEEEDANQAEQHPDEPHANAFNMPQEPPFGLSHLEALEQCLSKRIDSRFQSMNDMIDSRLAYLYDRVSDEVQRQEETFKEQIEHIIFVIRTI